MVMTGRLSTRDRIEWRPVIRWGVTARRDGGMQPTPLRVGEIVAILAAGGLEASFRSIKAARLMGNPFGGNPRIIHTPSCYILIAIDSSTDANTYAIPFSPYNILLAAFT